MLLVFALAWPRSYRWDEGSDIFSPMLLSAATLRLRLPKLKTATPQAVGRARESLMCLRAARRLKHQITTLRQASLGIRARPVPDGSGDEDTAPAAETSSPAQPVLLFSNDGSVSIAQARDPS